MNENTILRTVPAANDLHKVPGFDPMKYLRKAVNEKGEPVMRLEPRYQRLWFRLACPKGRLLLNPLRITDQLAIFEAKVFFHRDDTAPASSFTSNKTAQETRNYIRAAQDEAMTIALDNAGFGIQLCDMTQPSSDGECPPLAQATGEKKPPAQSHVQAEPSPMQEAPPVATVHKPADPKNTPAAQMKKAETPPAKTVKAATAAEPAPEPAPTVQPAAASQTADTVAPTSAAQPVPAHNPPPAPAAENLPAQVERQEPMDADKHEKSAESDGQKTAEVTVLDFPAQMAEMATPAGEAPNQPETIPQAAPSYTDDMPMEEICKVMTLEEAGAIMVPRGPNTGLTMAQVAERRPSSLRFFITQFYECSNIQKAAATLLLQNLEQKKAG